MIGFGQGAGLTAAVALLCAMAVGCADPSTVGGYELTDALVAMRVEGESAATVGPRDLASGTRFDLYAVLRGRRGGEMIYFTQADGLDLGGSAVPSTQLRPWPEDRRARVRWFTIEGTPPYSEWPERRQFPEYQELFRPEWGAGWSVPGDIRPSNPNLAFGAEDLGPRSFGTARFHVRVEVYATQGALTPAARYRSPSVDDDGVLDSEVARVTMALAPPLDVASQAFGLPQIEGLPDETRLRDRFTSMAHAGTLFSRAWVLRGALVEAGIDWEQLAWRPLDLSAPEGERASWGTDLVPGDLLRVGARVVFAFRDAEEPSEQAPTIPGVVDYSDLCLDFSRGAAVRALSDVFTGGGDVEVASLSRPVQ